MTAIRPLDLKVSVMIRIALGALFCTLVAAVFVVSGTHRELVRALESRSQSFGDYLSLQAFRADAGSDRRGRFPDWQFLSEQLLDEGLCVRVSDPAGRSIFASCRGSDGRAASPSWFAELYRTLFSPWQSIRHGIDARGNTVGIVEVSLDPAVGAARAWQDVGRTIWIIIGSIALLALIAYLAIDHAMRPARRMLAGIERIAGGDLSCRLPPVRLIELQQISTVINRMAARLETTLAEREELSRRLAIAQEEERRHLARELHDEFGQSLAAINAIAASVEATAEGSCPELVPEAQNLSEIAIRMMGELRNTVARLRPAIIDEVGLVESLRGLVAGWNSRLGRTTRFSFATTGSFHGLPDAAAVSIFRIAQEGLTNAARHAEARNVGLRLERLPAGGTMPAGVDVVQLTIEDDGKGCDWPRAPQQGAGLAGMRERIALFGGQMALGRVGPEGTRLSITMPASFGKAAA
jgi:signal transduction histidine kinase